MKHIIDLGRECRTNPMSGAEFYWNYLHDLFENPTDFSKIQVILDGTPGYATAFFEQALLPIAETYGRKRFWDRFEFVSDEEPLLLKEIERIVARPALKLNWEESREGGIAEYNTYTVNFGGFVVRACWRPIAGYRFGAYGIDIYKKEDYGCEAPSYRLYVADKYDRIKPDIYQAEDKLIGWAEDLKSRLPYLGD